MRPDFTFGASSARVVGEDADLPSTPRRPRSSARGTVIAVLLGVLALLGAACSSGGGDAPAAGGSGGAFPATVTGKFGSTTVPAKPLRVVAMSWTDADLALGLGIVPVGMPRVPTQQTGIEPWTQARLNGATPTLFDVANDDPVEAVAALKPDLILATKDYNLDRSYAQLSQFAPVVTYQQAPNSETWQQGQRSVATALGVKEQGEALINETQSRIQAAAASHPGLNGKTFSLIVTPQPSGFYVVNSNEDASAQFLSSLGLKIAPALASQPTSSIPGRALLSWERLGLVDADLVTATGPPSSLALLRSQPGFPALPAVAAGRYLPLTPVQAQSIAFPSAVSLQWSIDNVIPALAGTLKA
ncbi:iron-siderophore ABC transporter substrate-binding protein [Actinomycetospora endophytica]|uniref:Iron-siderophore ABC transporter substrate-binding protein n=1 Tax=Actinomycetospora endophytica TaxID=2291215 RepID=A0ABS8PJB1_9PSEU|nr:iron-siderophore ABC transporter substrate-binding protein [Actinomycetospora endophytica]MCD2197600.1 iron-siderophore ABC transporter substrate-binding protein [Actinomycetospora endophytica]